MKRYEQLKNTPLWKILVSLFLAFSVIETINTAFDIHKTGSLIKSAAREISNQKSADLEDLENDQRDQANLDKKWRNRFDNLSAYYEQRDKDDEKARLCQNYKQLKADRLQQNIHLKNNYDHFFDSFNEVNKLSDFDKKQLALAIKNHTFDPNQCETNSQ